MVEQAKARVAAVKESLAEQPAAAGAPKPPVKKKEEGPKPTDASDHPLVKKLKAKFGEAIGEASSLSVSFRSTLTAQRIVEICDFLKSDQRDELQLPFGSDVRPLSRSSRRAVRDRLQPVFDRRERARPFESQNETRALKVLPVFGPLRTGSNAKSSICLECASTIIRICVDCCCRRIGKDIRCEKIIRWSLSRTRGPREHLPEMTDVEMEQLQQRRAYGLEILSVPQERMMREIFRGGKEVMPKDK